MAFLVAHEIRRAAIVLADGPRDFRVVTLGNLLGDVVAPEQRIDQMARGDFEPAEKRRQIQPFPECQFFAFNDHGFKKSGEHPAQILHRSH